MPTANRVKRAMSARPSRPTTPHVSEKQEQKAICDLIRAIGGQVYVIGTKRRRGDYQGTCQTPGIPDLFAFLPVRPASPRGLWIEVKALKGRPSLAQSDFALRCYYGDIAHVMGTHDDVAKWLKLNGFLK